MGSRHLVSPKISRERMQDLQIKAARMQQALLSNSEDKVACKIWLHFIGARQLRGVTEEFKPRSWVDTPRL